MTAMYRKNSSGFVLIEALVAALIVALGILALSKLEAMVISSAGEARERSEAVTLARAKLEELRNVIVLGQYTAHFPTGSGSGSDSPSPYTRSWTYAQNGALSQHVVKIDVSWVDRAGNARHVYLNSIVGWDDTTTEVRLTKSTRANLITPTGAARRGTGRYTGGKVTVETDSANRTLLKNKEGDTILYLDAGANGQPQSFTTISGRVYFDQRANSNAIPSSENVRVRLSSEGECIYENTPLESYEGGGDYKYFTYKCYVGPGWYGNVGIAIDSTVNGQAGDPTICLGDPGFNNGVNNSTSTSAHPKESTIRSYRGYYYDSALKIYLPTGVAGGRSYYPDGAPLPSNYPTFYQNIVHDYFEHNFLITVITGKNDSCKSKLQLDARAFTQNAGKYYCLSPDDDTGHADACPTVWPGYESEVGSGGSINWTLIVSKDGNGSGTVSSTPSGVDCGSGCSASFATGTTVTLAPTAGAGSVFSGWSGDCTGTGTCTLDMSTNKAVTATFSPSAITRYMLAVTLGGAGAGAVTSSPVGISCGAACSADFDAGTTVTLTAAPTGSTFTGWSGGGATCTGTGSCTVIMDAAKNITATFQPAVTTYTLTVTKTGAGAATGKVSSSPAGVDCGTTCSASFNSGQVVTLTATGSATSVFAGWGGACASYGSAATCDVTMSAVQSVTAQFSPNPCDTPISGTRFDKLGVVAVTNPSTAGSCTMDGGNSAGYKCTLTTAPGTQVTLTNSYRTGKTLVYSYERTVTANCSEQTNVNFRQ